MKRQLGASERAVLVAEYLVVPHGQKQAWLAQREISGSAMSNWRRAYLFGDLELELVPRDTSGMSVSDGARMKQLELQLARERSARAEEAQRHAEEIARLNQVNEALGKAIGLLHDRSGEQEPTDRR